MWFQVWNTSYLPLVMDRPIWHFEGENLKPDDLVYFKLTDTKLASDWRYGKVEYVDVGRDGLVRKVGVSYKVMVENVSKVYNEDFKWKRSVVERPARSIVKLCNIEDTSILEDLNAARKLTQEVLKKITEGNPDRTSHIVNIFSQVWEDDDSTPGAQEDSDKFKDTLEQFLVAAKKEHSEADENLDYAIFLL